MNFQSFKQSKLIQKKEKEFLEFPGHQAETGHGAQANSSLCGPAYTVLGLPSGGRRPALCSE
jgi:hypothetical protein